MNRWLSGALLSVVFTGCQPRVADGGPRPDAAPAAEAGPRFGELMVEVGHRFELMGKAERARRYELAAFELDEIKEVFEDDMPHAEAPQVPPGVDLRALASAFVNSQPKDLLAALTARDPVAFSAAFARTATACNACHQATRHAYIEVPTGPGEGVPRLTPLPEAAKAGAVDPGARPR